MTKNIPKQLPTNWAESTLDQLGQLYCGQSSPVGEVNHDKIGTPYVTGPEQWDGDRVVENKWTEFPRRIVPEGCIFITVKGAGVGKMFPGIHAAIGRDIYAFKPHNEMDFDFVFFAIRHSIDALIANAQGDIPGLSKSHILDHVVAIPGHDEQRRIVSKLEELFSELANGIESIKMARQQTTVYRQSVLKQAFEGKLTAHWRGEADAQETRAAPTEHNQSLPQPTPEIHTLPSLPSTWRWSNLGDIADITGGLTKNPARNHFPRRVRYLRVANVYADSLNLAEIHEIGVTAAELDRVLLQRGDLLIVEGNGSIDQIGRVAAWNGEIPECGHQNHIIKARPHENVRTRYLLHFLLSKVGRDLIIRVASSTSGLHTLSIAKVSNLKIPLTCVEEQEQVLLAIDEKLSVAEKFIEEIDKAILACEVLRRSILKSAFTGKLIAQDPKDEPACALLERIKTARANKEKTKKKNPKRKAA